MQAIREYLIGVVAAALLCALVSMLVEPKGTVGVAVKLVSGFLMLLAVLQPLVKIQPEGLFRWTDAFVSDGTTLVNEGKETAKEYYTDSIKQQLTTYILDEAREYNCALSVDIQLSDEDVPVPRQIRLSGDVSPYARQVLTNLLAERLGLNREDLIWI